MPGGDAGDEHLLPVLQQLGGDLHDLFRRLAGAKDDFGEILPERAVRVHPREAEVGHRRGLKCAQDFFARNCSGAESLQQADGFNSCHPVTMP